MPYTAEELAQHMENDCMLVGWDDVPAMLRSQATEIARLREAIAAERERSHELLQAADHIRAELEAKLAALLGAVDESERERDPHYPCRSDGRCQYAIDHGAEGMGHCPAGKCAMPEGA